MHAVKALFLEIARKALTKTYKAIRSYNNNPTVCGQELTNWKTTIATQPHPLCSLYNAARSGRLGLAPSFAT